MREIEIFLKSSDLFNKGQSDKITRKEFYQFFQPHFIKAFKGKDLKDTEQRKERTVRFDDTLARDTPSELFKTKDEGKSSSRPRSQERQRGVDIVKNEIHQFLKSKDMREKAFWGLINPDRKTFLTGEEMIEHMGNVGINLDAVDVGVFFDYIDESEHGKIVVEDFERVLTEGMAKGTYWK